MERALNETDRRREKQLAYNEKHGITPATVKKHIGDIIAHVASKDQVTVDIGLEDRPHMVGHNLRAYIEDLEKQMRAVMGLFENYRLVAVQQHPVFAVPFDGAGQYP